LITNEQDDMVSLVTVFLYLSTSHKCEGLCHLFYLLLLLLYVLYVYYITFPFKDASFWKHKKVVFVLSCHAFTWYSVLDFFIVEEMRQCNLFEEQNCYIFQGLVHSSSIFYGTVYGLFVLWSEEWLLFRDQILVKLIFFRT